MFTGVKTMYLPSVYSIMLLLREEGNMSESAKTRVERSSSTMFWNSMKTVGSNPYLRADSFRLANTFSFFSSVQKEYQRSSLLSCSSNGMKIMLLDVPKDLTFP